jgi:Ca2+-binding EF-hand superfamily protein
MHRLLGIALAVLMSATLVSAAEDAEKGKGKRDGAVVFKRLDANSDGKITAEEFKKLGEAGKGRLKDKPEMLDRLFKRLDANNDGSLSQDELKKIGEGLKGKKPAKP